MRRTIIALFGLGALHCSDGGSIEVFFPSDGARAATVRIALKAYDVDGMMSCADVLGLAAKGDTPGAPVVGEGFERYPLRDNTELEVPPGRVIVHLLGYTSEDPTVPPFLEGCTDRFDSGGSSDDVPITFGFVLPESTRVVKVAGDRQVALRAGAFPRTLDVMVEATGFTGGGRTYPIPGVPFFFEILTDGFTLGGAGSARVAADANGVARMNASGPAPSASGTVVATAVPLEDRGAIASVTFELSVRDGVTGVVTRRIEGDGRRSVASAIGDFTTDGATDLAVVGCVGAQLCDRTTGTTLRRFDDIVGRGTSLPLAPETLGFGARDVAIVPLRDAQSPAVVVLNAVRADSEGAEVWVVEGNRAERLTMTGSNAVALVDLETPSGRHELGVVASGRREHTRPCLRNPGMCIEYRDVCEDQPELCDCPPAETCDCIDCSKPGGVCVARDEQLDIIALRASGPDELYNRGGCQTRDVFCNNNPLDLEARCACLDDRGGTCAPDENGCGCLAPRTIRIGPSSASFEPTDGFAARLSGGTRPDVVFTSQGGLAFLVSGSAVDQYTWTGSRNFNGAYDGVVAAEMDGDGAPDLAWFSQRVCTPGAGFDEQCPNVSETNNGEGCLGIISTDGSGSVVTVSPPGRGTCRRMNVPFAPSDICIADFNGDGDDDVALTAPSIGTVSIYIGDGRGGVSDPPVEISLPDMEGGVLSCGNLDGLAADDMIVVDTNGGTIAVFTLSAGAP